MDEATKTKTMRELLIRWAEAEPGRCHFHEEIEGFTVNCGSCWDLIVVSNAPSEDNLMRIQRATQVAIIARGWAFTIKYIARYKRHLASVGFTYDQEGSNLAEAILSAYLKEIEAQDQ